MHPKSHLLQLIEDIRKAQSPAPAAGTGLKRYDFSKTRADFARRDLAAKVRRLKEAAWGLAALRRDDSVALRIITLSQATSEKDLSRLDELQRLVEEARLTDDDRIGIVTLFSFATVPQPIRREMELDVAELERAYNAGCLRSSIILCGRILETALFRKYYELTGKDLLATSANLGLGKLIAKLSEQDFTLDPGIKEQVHLVNNVRIQSVHTKKQAFYPTSVQTKAMVLYTADVLKRLFPSPR
ncbi:hypothetical protein JXB02_00120 [Candidatus Woesearchaeota archaeon]|nr:hypothetical protein [Candidatus Woesearchaeota archaeon]